LNIHFQEWFKKRKTNDLPEYMGRERAGIRPEIFSERLEKMTFKICHFFSKVAMA